MALPKKSLAPAARMLILYVKRVVRRRRHTYIQTDFCLPEVATSHNNPGSAKMVAQHMPAWIVSNSMLKILHRRNEKDAGHLDEHDTENYFRFSSFIGFLLAIDSHLLWNDA